MAALIEQVGGEEEVGLHSVSMGLSGREPANRTSIAKSRRACAASFVSPGGGKLMGDEVAPQRNGRTRRKLCLPPRPAPPNRESDRRRYTVSITHRRMMASSDACPGFEPVDGLLTIEGCVDESLKLNGSQF